MKRGAITLLAASWLGSAPVAAQTMRDFSVERGRRSETSLRVVLDFAAGELFLRPSATGALYRIRLRYDADRFEPISSYDPERRVVRLGLGRAGRGGLRAGHRDLAQRAVIEISPDVGLTLDATLGATESSLELGGLRLEDLAVSVGASRADIRFSRPNPGPCRRAEVTSGAAELRIGLVGNSGCARWVIEGGVGQVVLDLGGEWPEAGRMAIRMTVGGVRLEAPAELGIRIRLTRFLAAFALPGFTRNGDVFTSANYASAARTVDLEIETTLGRIDVTRK